MYSEFLVPDTYLVIYLFYCFIYIANDPSNYGVQGQCASDAHAGTSLYNSYYQWVAVYFLMSVSKWNEEYCIYWQTLISTFPIILGSIILHSKMHLAVHGGGYDEFPCDWVSGQGGGQCCREAGGSDDQLLWICTQQVQQICNWILLLWTTQSGHHHQSGDT